MEPTTLRERLARDIFLADNSNAPEEQMLKDWDDPVIRPDYAYVIADGLIAKGYRHVRWAA